MTTAAIVALGLAAVAAAADWLAVARARRTAEYVAKPLVVALLVAAAVLLDPADPAQRAWFVGALVASLVGDVCLMLPSARAPAEVEKAGEALAGLPPAFAVGLVAFLVAHVAYVVGFFIVGIDAGPALVGATLVVVAGLTAGRRILRSSRRSGDPRVTAALAAYLVVIGVMVVAAFGSGSPLAAAGAMLFFVSDALIGWSRFVRPLPWAPLAIIVAYHLGQAGLVGSLAGG